MFVYIEPTDPTNPNSRAQARLAFTREEAEYHSPFVLPFDSWARTTCPRSLSERHPIYPAWTRSGWGFFSDLR
jgi:hypothetical protein